MKQLTQKFSAKAIRPYLMCALSFILVMSLTSLPQALATEGENASNAGDSASILADESVEQGATKDGLDGSGTDGTDSGTTAGSEAEGTGIDATNTQDAANPLAASILAVSQLPGSGTVEDPLRIYTGQNLYDFAVCFNAGQLPTGLPTGTDLYLSLMNDIDLSQFGNWTPIGYYGSAGDRPFQGTFQSDGANTYTVAGLSINATISASNMSYGLFGYANGATFKNVQVDASIIAVDTSTTGYQHSAGGALVGRTTDGAITGCAATGTVSVSARGTNVYAGGLVGYAQSTFNSCWAAVTATATGGTGNSNIYAADWWGTPVLPSSPTATPPAMRRQRVRTVSVQVASRDTPGPKLRIAMLLALLRQSQLGALSPARGVL